MRNCLEPILGNIFLEQRLISGRHLSLVLATNVLPIITVVFCVRQEVSNAECSLSLVASEMNVADQASCTRRVEDEAPAHLIRRWILSTYVLETLPDRQAGRPPPVIKPVRTLRMASLRFLNCRSSDNVHYFPRAG